MLSLVRPNPRPDFATEAKPLLDEVRRLATANGGSVQSVAFKGREIWSGAWKGDGRHKVALGADFGNYTKCSFCERLRDLRGELNVEHFRPKAEISEWLGSPPEVSDEPPPVKKVSGGYWWLAFTWTNYSLACGRCNQKWKRNLFPVSQPRPSYVEGMEVLETPLLLDPMTPFCTASHFKWDQLGYMWGVSDAGRATIITCGLNRKQLAELRRKSIPNVLRALDRFTRNLDRGRSIEEAERGLRDLAILGARTSEFAGMVRWFVEDRLRVQWENINGLPL